MSPNHDREPVIVSRVKPTGATIYYPICGDWWCDDEYDWEWIGPNDEDYPAVRREHQIVAYHEPRNEAQRRLTQERNKLTSGDPLWVGRPHERTPE